MIDYRKVIENKNEEEFYRRVHKDILNYLSQYSPTTFWEIIRKIRGSDRRVLRLLNEMVKTGEIIFRNKRVSSKLKINKAKKEIYDDCRCKYCDEKLIPINGYFKHILEKLKKIHKVKPTPTFLFDQRPVTLETTVRRAAYLMWRGDLIGKRIVVVGDDDLTSLAIGLTKLAKEVIVFDIDKRLIKFINMIAKQEGLKIKAFVCDLSKKIPVQFFKKFDVFLADPTPIREAFSLFLDIGLNLLKDGIGLVGYLSFFPSHQKISEEFQKVLCKRRVIITDMIPRFTEYDFIKDTYHKNDLRLLKKFSSNERKLSFHENIMRFESTLKTVKMNININQTIRKKIVGKATKNILKNIKNDPAYRAGDTKFILETAKKLRRGIEDE